MNYDYSVQIVWSNEDGAYLAAIQELPGCIADGQTREEALANVAQMAKDWVEVASEEGREIPRPLSMEDFEAAKLRFQQTVNQHIQSTIARAVAELVPKAVKQILQEIKNDEGEQFHRGLLAGGLRFDTCERVQGHIRIEAKPRHNKRSKQMV